MEVLIYFHTFAFMWKCKGKNVKNIPENAYGFIYMIENLDAKEGEPRYYIGKKNFYFERKVILGKREYEALGNKRLKKYKYVVSESDWQTYNSSCKPLLEAIANGAKIKKTILEFCHSKRELTYKEVKYLFIYEVLERKDYYNANIMNRFYDNVLN